MNGRVILIAALLCFALMVCIMVMTDDAQAQSADQKLASREGLGDKDIDANQLPGKFEIGLAVGSIIAMIGVMKFV